jgi:hypothetical protein
MTYRSAPARCRSRGQSCGQLRPEPHQTAGQQRQHAGGGSNVIQRGRRGGPRRSQLPVRCLANSPTARKRIGQLLAVIARLERRDVLMVTRLDRLTGSTRVES